MTVRIDDVIAAYMTLRGKKAAIEAQTKAEVAKIKEKMDKLEAYLKAHMDAQGLSSFKSPHGTAFLTTTDYANVADWGKTLAFILDNGFYEMLEKRVTKTAIREYIQNHKAVPPGVTYGTKLEVNVRKPGAEAEV